MKVLPIQIHVVSEGGYVVSATFQKEKDVVNFSKFAKDEKELGETVTEAVKKVKGQ